MTDAQAVALAALGRRVEAHFGAPQDIEWALDAAGALWLTQARPITSLYPVPPSRDGALRAFVCASLAQGLTRPITPMGLAAFGVHRRHRGPAGRPPRAAHVRPGGTAARLRPGRRAGVRRRHRGTAQPDRSHHRDLRPEVHGGPHRGGAARTARRPRVRPRPARPAAGAAPDRARAGAVPRAAGDSPSRRLSRGGEPSRRTARRPRRRLPAVRAGRHRRRAAGAGDGGARVGPAGVPRQRPGLRCRLPHARGRAPAGRRRPGRRHDGRRAALAAEQRHHRDGPAALGAGAAGPLGSGLGRRPGRRRRTPRSPPGSTPAPCPRCCRTGSPSSCAATATAPSPRSTSACRAGREQPEHVLGALANYQRLDGSRRRTRCPVRRGRAGRAACRRGRRRPGPASLPVAGAGRRVRPRTRARAGRAARGTQGPPRPADRPRPGRAGRRRRRAGRARPPRRPRRRLLPRPVRRRRPRSAAPTCGRSSATGARSTRASCAAGTCRGCCSPTAPNPRPSPAPAPRTTARWSAPRPRPAPSPRRRASSSTRSARGWSRARSSSHRPPTPAGHRCSSPREGS